MFNLTNTRHLSTLPLQFIS